MLSDAIIDGVGMSCVSCYYLRPSMHADDGTKEKSLINDRRSKKSTGDHRRREEAGGIFMGGKVSRASVPEK